jgi:hypothetical protein
LWFVDPDLLRHGQRLGRLADEALRMSTVGGVENRTTPFNRFRSQTIMNHSRREKAQSGMAVLVVIPGEELLGEGTGILERPKAFRETGSLFQGPEVAFRIWVVVGNMRPAVGFGDPQIRHEKGDGFGGH